MQSISAEIVPGKRGIATVRATGENGRETYLHSIYDPLSEADAMVPDSVEQKVLVFLGTGLGYHIPLTLARHPQVERVVLVEVYPALAAAARARIEASGVAVDVITVDNPRHCRETSIIPAGLDALKLLVIPHYPSLRANPTWYAGCQAAFATAGQARRQAVGTGPARGQRTIMVLYGAFYGQSECIRGFESLGHRVITLDYREGEGETVSRFSRAVLQEQPDLVFSVNMRGFDRQGVMGEVLERLGIPLALWFVDSPEFILHDEFLPPREITTVFMWDRHYIPLVKRLGYRARYLPLAADPALAEAAQPSARYQSGISFVGNSLLSGFLSRLASKFPHNDTTQELLAKATQAILGNRGHQLEALDALLASRQGEIPSGEERLFFRAYALHSATTLYRCALLERLLPAGLVFHGDPDGWRRLFGSTVSAHADVNYFSELPAVYASSDVNFNATSLQMPSAVNQRVFDVPLCGGFLLTDRQDDLFELFADDEVAVYAGHEEVAGEAAFYLARPSLRREIMTRARERVLGEHTYRRRMGELLQRLEM